MANHHQSGGCSNICLCKIFVFIALISWLITLPASAVIEPNEVLILVNKNSNTGKYIARLYRQYYPDIPESQVLYLNHPDGCVLDPLPDCSGPDSTAADEIITREQYKKLIAKPVRDYLLNNNLVDKIKVILTTAGLPYRIEDLTYSTIVMPGGGTVYQEGYIGNVDAASVESELTLLFQTDVNGPDPLEIWDRVVNTYQGYRNSGMELFNRDILGNLNNHNWRYPRKLSANHYPPRMEGDYRTAHGVRDRNFSVGDMYLTCRLDGPKNQGQSAVFSVRKILQRAKRASDPQFGIDPNKTVAVLDDAPWANNFNYNRIYNVNRYVDYIVFDSNVRQPPDTFYAELRDDYDSGFKQMTGFDLGYGDTLYEGFMEAAEDLMVICDRRNEYRTNQTDINSDEVVISLASFGTNGDEGDPSSYLFTSGPGGGQLFELAYGAVFYSIESYSAATMFLDVTTSYDQGKIINFFSIGGCGAIGHSFEPYEDASINTEFLFYNLLADHDSSNHADLTFIEAAFTAIPYISWTEIVIGDPLMQIAYGPGGNANDLLEEDFNDDGTVNMQDLAVFAEAYLSSLYSADHNDFDRYNDICDLDHNETVDLQDFAILANFF